jgi:hypothetical protein
MEHVWLHHPETKGFFHCPAAAVADWLGLGYERSDPPEESNPVVAERIAWEREQAAKQPAKPTTARRSAATEPKE